MPTEFYVERSDQQGTRGFDSFDAANKALNEMLSRGNVPHDATVRLKRADGSTRAEYKWTTGDDGYASWHLQH
jgi:transcriptional regulator of nitric oxide reductase